MSTIYIHRKLHCGEQLIWDDELLDQGGVFVVLAEPGAGKSDLLDYFGQSRAVPRDLASLFLHRPSSSVSMLIVDALDEVARISEDKINEIIVKARASGASMIIFASRSYVWDEARTRVVRDCFGADPTILRLEPFDDDEQRQLFNCYVPDEDFDAFRTEVDRLELTPILGNPQFLKLFADAYVEGGRRFDSKRQIYADALRRLASEMQDTAGLRDRPQTTKILAAASEVFAKLLLSGATGVSAREDVGDAAYPFLRSVGPDDGILIFALNTRLFKPTASVNKHEPVHRIVAEYCAADFLAKRIEDPTNTLSIKRCLAVIAPNGSVRNELRGMLGWMASLGGRSIQEAVVDLDPYAVFANGDASQLLASSKQRLLKGLESLAKTDPFFRRMDSWRRFDVAGFFSSGMIPHVRPLLTSAHANSHLRGLLLELLQGTDAAIGLRQDLRAILHDSRAEMIEDSRLTEISA